MPTDNAAAPAAHADRFLMLAWLVHALRHVFHNDAGSARLRSVTIVAGITV